MKVRVKTKLRPKTTTEKTEFPTKFDTTLIDKVTEKFKALSQEIEREMGVTLEIGNIRYCDENFTSKLTATLVGGDSVDGLNYKLNATRLKLVPLNSVITWGNEEFFVIGLKTKIRQKYPIIAKSVKTGEKFELPLGSAQKNRKFAKCLYCGRQYSYDKDSNLHPGCCGNKACVIKFWRH